MFVHIGLFSVMNASILEESKIITFYLAELMTWRVGLVT